MTDDDDRTINEVSCSSCGRPFLITGRTEGFSACDQHDGMLTMGLPR